MATLSANALQILKSRYLRRNARGKVIETPEQMFGRVAKAVAGAELKLGNRPEVKFWENAFFRMMNHLEFLPNSPTLMNAGLERGQLSACFVLPVEDCLEGIFTTLKNAALIHQSGGGTGFNFSLLRPAGDEVSLSGGTSSGPVSFIRIFNMATEEVRQGGRRRGANMAILNVNHPDIEEFITAKADGKSLRNFNLSVGITDSFMEAVANDFDWPLINPRTGEPIKSVKARQLWNLIIYEAWRTGDPGLIFLDTVNRFNPTPALGKLTCTNPCGEMPLLPYESCNLGSINLSKIVRGETGGIDWEKLEETIEFAVRFLDNVIEANHYILPEIEETTKATRKIGLGVMGWADLLIELGIPYASDEAVELAQKLMRFIHDKSMASSIKLAKERGVFPAWEKSVYFQDRPLRNASRTSIAPTGTISILADASSSIEPLYGLAYRRLGILENKIQTEVNKSFMKKMRRESFWSEALAANVGEKGTLESLVGIPRKLRHLFLTSLEIPWCYHLEHQLAFQKYTDSAVSKTINLSFEATQKVVESVFFTAWKFGAKGITLFRSGSRDKQVLYRGGIKKGRSC